MTASTATRYEVQVDAEIDRLAGEVAARSAEIERLDTAVDRIVDAGPDSYTWEVLGGQVTVDAHRARMRVLSDEIAALLAALRTEEDKYTGWTRYFLVNNSNGHVHRDTNCSTCYISTEYKWLTDFSGQAEAEVVELAGERCCTVCYPDAPVEKKADRAFRSDDEIAAEQRAAERAEKLAAKNAKAINPDGSELRITATTSRYGETLKTIVSTANFYAERIVEAERVTRYCPQGNADLIADYVQQAEQALVALAARSEVTVEAKRTELAKKVAAKLKRELG